MKTRSQRGFTLLEVLVATLIMGIAVGGVLSGLAAASRNASRLSQHDRASLLARQKMDELIVDQTLPRRALLQGGWDSSLTAGAPSGWTAMVTPFDTGPTVSAGQPVIDRIALEIWWMDGSARHSFKLDGFRRGQLRGEDMPGAQ